MARKANQVTLTFAGDSEKLEKSFNRVGSSAREMSGDVGTASTEASNAGSSFDSMGSRVGDTEQKMRGFRDIIDGSGDAVRGFATGDISLMTRGLADIAAGSADLVIPALKRMVTWISNTRVGILAQTAATKTATAAQRAMNLVMRANPIGLVVTALVALGAALVVAYKKSETFRNIVNGAMRGVRSAFGWVLDRGRDLLGWFRDLPRKIGGFFRGLGESIVSPFRRAVSGIKSAWNNTLGGRGFDVPGWVPGIGGNSYRIPYLHQGGIVPGSPGEERLAVLQAGERVTPAGQVRRESRRDDEPITVYVMISEEKIAGIAKVEITKGNKKLRTRVDQGSAVAA